MRVITMLAMYKDVYHLWSQDNSNLRGKNYTNYLIYKSYWIVFDKPGHVIIFGLEKALIGKSEFWVIIEGIPVVA